MGKPAGVQTSTRTRIRDIPVPMYPRVPAGKGLCAGMLSKGNSTLAFRLVNRVVLSGELL
ncbi:hypothetical protein M405DRAFT_861567 [Rhizopogon salebrosus TDB-379]|nr:hypothetical protein M405DRAFT_861567 [Rhizopogon salebrosus TDB-379]